jgi:2-polyprenyl-3-methyl-5-hydroxy-6-metoxy-1,4-benzoquinol methylase
MDDVARGRPLGDGAGALPVDDLLVRMPVPWTERPPRRCPVCESSAIETIDEVPQKKDFFDRTLRLGTCTECRALFQPFVPNTHELARWYDYMGHVPAASAMTPLLDRRLVRIARTLAPFRATGRLLEVGPGGGLFIDAAERQGWEAYATEISPTSCARLRQTLGSRLHEGEVLTAPFLPGSFDAVVMIEVVEHLVDPYQYFIKIRELLRPGGALFLTTPNFRGLSGRLLGTDWRIVVDEHVNYFDPSSITQLLRRARFSSVSNSTSNLDHQALREMLPLRRPVSSIISKPAAKNDQPPSHGAAFRAVIADEVIEVANRLLAKLGLGDTLRSLAVKT